MNAVNVNGNTDCSEVWKAVYDSECTYQAIVLVDNSEVIGVMNFYSDGSYDVLALNESGRVCDCVGTFNCDKDEPRTVCNRYLTDNPYERATLSIVWG